MCVPCPARRDHSEPSTSPCRSRGTATSPPPATGGGVRAGRPMCVPHPALRDHSEPSTSPCRSRGATSPHATCSGCLHRAAHVCAASGASPSQRAEHVPVPPARRDNPPRPGRAGGEGGGGICAGRPMCALHPVRRDHSEPSTSPYRSPDATCPPRHVRRGSAPGGPCVYRIRRVAITASRARTRAARAARHAPTPRAAGVLAGRPMCVPHPARRHRSESSTSPCRPRGAICPTRHGRRRFPPGGPCVCRARCVTITASRARPRAARAARQASPATCGGGPRRAAHVCAASGASRSQRAEEHVPVPPARRDNPPRPGRAEGGRFAPGGPCARRIRCVAITASRARPRAARAARHAHRQV
jgi:hypothetical protein